MRITELDKGEEARLYLKSGATIDGTILSELSDAGALDVIEIMTEDGITYIEADQIAAYTRFGSKPE